MPVEDVADSCFGLLVRDVDNLADAVGAPALQAGQMLSGLLVPARREILVNASEARTWPPRRRFTICHELGHWVMHRTGHEPLFCRAIGTEPQPDLRPPRPPYDVAADAFAAALLMPDELVVEAFHRVGGELRALCELFDTSQAAMTRRLRSLGLMAES